MEEEKLIDEQEQELNEDELDTSDKEHEDEHENEDGSEQEDSDSREKKKLELKNAFKKEYLTPAQKGYVDRKLDKALDQRVDKLYKYFESEIENKLSLYDKALNTVTDKMKQAIEDNDLQAYHEANEQKQNLEKEKEKISKVNFEDTEEQKNLSQQHKLAEESQEQEVQIELEPDAEKWVNQNKNFLTKVENDPELSYLVNVISKKLREQEGYDSKPQIQLFNEVKKRVVNKYPEYFDSRAADLPNVSGGKMSSNNNNKYSWSNVPESERIILKNHIRAGIYANEEEALKSYFE